MLRLQSVTFGGGKGGVWGSALRENQRKVSGEGVRIEEDADRWAAIRGDRERGDGVENMVAVAGIPGTLQLREVYVTSMEV